MSTPSQARVELMERLSVVARKQAMRMANDMTLAELARLCETLEAQEVTPESLPRPRERTQ